jgi:hypothetical protein
LTHVIEEVHRVSQKDLLAHGTFGTIHAPIGAEINTFSMQTKESFHLT